MDNGIIFGQRGQGLLTSGRGAIFGQRGALDPIVQAYGDILATDPTVPVLLQLTEYRGQQILFQDPACTIPVESPGDPIGGVRHPLTGEIIAVQETDSERPVWGGVSVGASFDGSGDHLILADGVLDDSLVQSLIGGGGSLITAVDLKDQDEVDGFFGWDGGDPSYWMRRVGVVSSTSIDVRRFDDAGNGARASNDDLIQTFDWAAYMATSVDASDSRVVTDAGNSGTQNAGVDPDNVSGVPDDVEVEIGGIYDRSDHLDGDMRALLLYDRIVDDSTFLDTIAPGVLQ